MIGAKQELPTGSPVSMSWSSLSCGTTQHTVHAAQPSTACACSGQLCCGSLTPLGTGLCQSRSLQPVLWGSQMRKIKWSQRCIKIRIWKWRLACVLQHCCWFNPEVLHSLTASECLMSPYKNMNWLLKIAHNWTLRSICFVSVNTFPVIILKYICWQ